MPPLALKVSVVCGKHLVQLCVLCSVGKLLFTPGWKVQVFWKSQFSKDDCVRICSGVRGVLYWPVDWPGLPVIVCVDR